MDVKTSFLNGVIKEKFYIEQLDGFVVHRKESHVYKFKRDLYGSSKHRVLGMDG